MTLFETFIQYLESESGFALGTVIAGPSGVGSKVLLRQGRLVQENFPNPSLLDRVKADLVNLLREERSDTIRYELDSEVWEVFVETYPPSPQIVVVGATDTAITLSRFAKGLGYKVVITDARAAFAHPSRFPEADEVIKGWPQDVLPSLRLDEATYVVLLSHDPKFDEPTLECVLPTAVPYIGAIGSRKTQSQRFARLRELGHTEAQLARVYGPVGLDLGGRSPAETALAIMAEITAVRHHRDGSFMRKRLAMELSS